MHIRSVLAGGFFAVLFTLCFASQRAQALEWHIGGGSGPYSFATLEDLRLALADPLGSYALGEGDVIVLHRDDTSLTAGLPLPDGVHVTIRSLDGGSYTVRPAGNASSGIFQAGGTNPSLTIENVRVAGGGTNARPFSLSAASGGRLVIQNSTFENLSNGGTITGDVTADIINSTFTNNGNINVAEVRNLAGQVTNLNVTLDRNAERWTTWKGGSTTEYSLWMDIYGDAAVNFNIASGKTLDIHDEIRGAHRGLYSALLDKYLGVIDIEKNGGGTLILRDGYIAPFVNNDGDIDYAGSFNFVVNQGRLWFAPNENRSSSWWDPNGTITFKSGTVFKTTLDPGNLEHLIVTQQDVTPGVTWFTGPRNLFSIDRFLSEEGSRLEIGLISTFPKLGNLGELGTHKIYMGIGYLSSHVDYSSIASSMQIKNSLLDAELLFGNLEGPTWDNGDKETYDGMFIKINRLENLASLEGVGEYADVYRKLTTLSDEERDLLDTIYCRGGLAGGDRAYFQTLSGSIVTNSVLNMRHNWTNMLRKINRRLTAYQHEELVEALDLGISGQGYASMKACDPIVDYVELWASVDQSWMFQNDKDSLAGYRYNNAGINIGMDRHIENVIVGGVLRYDDGTMKLQSNRATRTETQTVMGSLYASWASEGWYWNGGLHAAYGWNESWSNYQTVFNSMTAETGTYGTTMFGANAETGYMYETAAGDLPLRITPFGGLGYAKIHRHAVTESGAGNLDRHFRRGDWDLWEASLGVRFDMPIDREGYVLVPSVEAAWNRTLGDSRNDGSDVNLIADPTGAWRVSTMSTNRSALHLSAGLNAHFARNMDIGANYDFEWRSKYHSHQLTVNFSLGF